MYTFTRCITLKNTSVAQKAIGFSMEVNAYINKAHGLNMRCGMEVFGHQNIWWSFDIDSLDKGMAINQKIFEDKAYFQMLEKGSEYWLEGSLKDTIVMYPTMK